MSSPLDGQKKLAWLHVYTHTQPSMTISIFVIFCFKPFNLKNKRGKNKRDDDDDDDAQLDAAPADVTQGTKWGGPPSCGWVYYIYSLRARVTRWTHPPHPTVFWAVHIYLVLAAETPECVTPPPYIVYATLYTEREDIMFCKLEVEGDIILYCPGCDRL